MKRVVYTDKDGHRGIYEVPDSLVDENEFVHGVRIGPPDLSRLPLSEEQRKLLNNQLCDIGILDYNDLSKQRDRAYNFLVDIAGHAEGKSLLRLLVAVYQQEAYGLIGA